VRDYNTGLWYHRAVEHYTSQTFGGSCRIRPIRQRVIYLRSLPQETKREPSHPIPNPAQPPPRRSRTVMTHLRRRSPAPRGRQKEWNRPASWSCVNSAVGEWVLCTKRGKLG